jgi:multidrug resistance protein
VVGTALPVIVTDLNGNALYTWVVTIYLLTATISGPIYGWLSDLFGRRPIIIFAVSLFLIGSVLCGLSQQMWQLILFRGIQGLGGGAIFPVSLAVVADLYTPAERGKYFGLFGAVFGLSSLIGPAIGGIITDTVGWHWIFFVNVPIGLISLAIIWRLLPAVRRPDAGRNIDYVGAAIFALAITLFLIGLTNKQSGQWSDPAVGGLILAGLAFGAVFIWVESRAADPIVPLALFRIRNFSVSVAALFLAAFGFLGAVIFLPRWFQTVAGASATESGYSILPLLVGLIFSAIASGQIVAHGSLQGPDARIAPPPRGRSVHAHQPDLGDRPRGAVVVDARHRSWSRPSVPVFTLVVQNSVAAARIGVATGSLTFFQQIGGTIGLTLASTVLAERLVTEIPIQLVAAGVRKPIVDRFAVGAGVDITGTGDLGQRILTSLPPETKALIEPLILNIVQGIHEAFSLAVASTFWVGIVGALVAFVFVLFLQEQPMRSTVEIGEPAVEESTAVPNGAIG